MYTLLMLGNSPSYVVGVLHDISNRFSTPYSPLQFAHLTEDDRLYSCETLFLATQNCLAKIT